MVELSQNVIQQRIEELDLKNRRKAQALEDSRLQLQNDETKLMQFIQADQIKTSGTEKDAERMMNQRKASEQVDKELNMQIINMRSEIEKQKDVVFGLRQLGDFLMVLSPPQWVEQVAGERARQMEVFKKSWIRDHQNDTRHDYIIFRGDDPIVFSA